MAGRVFDVVTNQNNIHSVIREIVPETTQEQIISYWRRVLRVAALFHDVGHLPFSHAAEKELLPEGWDHEKITIEIIVYFHPIRRIYDIHLKDFLSKWLQNGKFSTNINNILDMTDNEVLVAIKEAAKDNTSPGHDPARRLLKREHFKLLYQRAPNDLKKNANANEVIFNAIKERYGEENVRRDSYAKNSTAYDFPVLCNDNRICSSYERSQNLQTIPVPSFDYIFIKPELIPEADDWLKKNRAELLKIKPEEE
ncbi:MAG: HD domain-containing protein [Clostridia bacterium]|nr:HD domain-containing protein [Clostridia bacterium]